MDTCMLWKCGIDGTYADNATLLGRLMSGKLAMTCLWLLSGESLNGHIPHQLCGASLTPYNPIRKHTHINWPPWLTGHEPIDTRKQTLVPYMGPHNGMIH